MNTAHRLVLWMVRPQVTIWDRIAIFVAFTGLFLLCVLMMDHFVRGIGLISRVHGHGTDTVARVEQDSAFSDYARLEYDGHTAAVRGKLASGERSPVTYLAADPKVVAFGHSSDDWFTLYLANVGWVETGRFIMSVAGAIGCLLCVLAAFAPAVPQRSKPPRVEEKIIT